MSIKIIGVGQYMPLHCVASTDLDQKLGLQPGTVQKKSGIISRHFASPHETSSYMAAQAALHAIQQANISPTDIDVIIAACGVGEQMIPCTASLVQKQLGLEYSGIACFDINSTCLSFITAFDIASHLIAAKRFKRALIVSSEIPSIGLDWQDHDTCTIFGDGAAACIIESSQETSRVLAAHMKTYSSGTEYCRVQAGGTRIPPASEYDKAFGLFTMDGKNVFKLASQIIQELQRELFAKANVTLDDIQWVVPHQASALAMCHIRKRLDIPDKKFIDIYAHHGNQMAASIPSVLCHLIQNHPIQRGELIYLLGTGAGLSAAGIILEY